jgi:hypothetical protein
MSQMDEFELSFMINLPIEDVTPPGKTAKFFRIKHRKEL